MLTLEGVEGAFYLVGQMLRDTSACFERSIMYLPECIINEYGAEVDYQRAIKPAFDALWNAAGYPSAGSFSTEGQWIGIQGRR